MDITILQNILLSWIFLNCLGFSDGRLGRLGFASMTFSRSLAQLQPAANFLKSMIIQQISCLFSNLRNFGIDVKLLKSWLFQVCWYLVSNFQAGARRLVSRATAAVLGGSGRRGDCFASLMIRSLAQLQPAANLTRLANFCWIHSQTTEIPGERSQLPLKPTSWKNLSFSAVKSFLAENSSVDFWVSVCSNRVF